MEQDGYKTNLINNLDEKRLPDNILKMEGQFVLERNGISILHAKISKQSVDELAVPKNPRNELIQWCHYYIAGVHLGIIQTYERIRSSYYWDKMFAGIQRGVFSCNSDSQKKRDNDHHKVYYRQFQYQGLGNTVWYHYLSLYLPIVTLQ